MDNPLRVEWEPSPIADWMGFSRRDFVFRVLGLSTLLLESARPANSSPAVSDEASGLFRIRVVDEDTGNMLPCTIQVVNSQGKIIIASESYKGGIRSTGETKLRLPAGPTRILVTRGFDYSGSRREVQIIPAGQELDLQIPLKRRTPLHEKGWYCSDHHVHMIHGESKILVEFSDIALAARSEALDCLSVAQQWNLPNRNPDSLEKACQSVSTRDFQLTWNLEAPKNYYRGDASHCLGHCWTVGMRGYDADGRSVIDELLNLSAWDYESEKPPSANFESHALIHAQGGIACYSHPCRWWRGRWGGKGIYPVESDKFISNMAVELPFDVIAGPTFDGVDILMQPHEHEANRQAMRLWFLLLNHGYRIAGTASSDATFDNPGGGVPGKVRIYSLLKGEYSLSKLAAAIKQGRSFVTSGPLLHFRMDAAEVGSILHLDAPKRLKAHIEAWASGFPGEYLTWVELIRNGEVVKRWDLSARPESITLETEVEEFGTCWYIARGRGSDENQIAITNPIFLEDSSYHPPQPTPANVTLTIRKAQTGQPLAGTCQVLERIGRQSRVLQSVKFEDGKLQLTVPATSRLQIEAEGHKPAEKSIFLDYPPLLDLTLNLRAEDLLTWNTFERIRSLLKDVHLSFELQSN